MRLGLRAGTARIRFLLHPTFSPLAYPCPLEHPASHEILDHTQEIEHYIASRLIMPKKAKPTLCSCSRGKYEEGTFKMILHFRLYSTSG